MKDYKENQHQKKTKAAKRKALLWELASAAVFVGIAGALGFWFAISWAEQLGVPVF